MSRIHLVQDAEAEGAAKEGLESVAKKMGTVPNLMRVMANQPAILNMYFAMGDALSKGSFGPKVREALALTIAGANHCDYCASAHSAISKSLKVDDAEIETRLKGNSADPELDAILKLTNVIVQKQGLLTDDDLRNARDSGISDAVIVEAIGHVAANILTNYINHIAETDIDFPVVRTQ